MRILWHSNATWANTGYGQQSAITIPELEKLGHEVAELPFYGYGGAKSVVNGRTIYPLGAKQFGEDMLPIAVKDFGADIVITLTDIWPLDADMVKEGKFLWCPWIPVDHDPLPPDQVTRLETSYRPISMSRFGERVITEAGDTSHYIPHSISTTTFRPDQEAGKAWRKEVNIPDDAFLVGMVAANKGWPNRKAYPECLEAFAEFAKGKENVYLFIHTAFDKRWQGVDLVGICKLTNCPEMRVKFPDPRNFQVGFSPDWLRGAYNAFDVLLNPSYSEGFGIPCLESQACGTPTIVTNFSAMPEVQGSGWLVDAERRWYTLLNSYQALPKVFGNNSIHSSLQDAYHWWEKGNGQLPQSFADNAREHALNYETTKIVQENWKPYLDSIEDDLATLGNDSCLVGVSFPNTPALLRLEEDGVPSIEHEETEPTISQLVVQSLSESKEPVHAGNA